jgi:hypothetical protein
MNVPFSILAVLNAGAFPVPARHISAGVAYRSTDRSPAVSQQVAAVRPIERAKETLVTQSDSFVHPEVIKHRDLPDRLHEFPTHSSQP